jgi:hypothetical protein
VAAKTKACRQAAQAVTAAAKALAQVAAAIISAVLGPVLESIANCVTRPTLASCAAAAGTVILIGAGFADVGAEAAADGGLADVVADCGGMSFAPSTKVLLANGKKTPISRLRPGQKVRTTSTRTGKDRARPIAAVLVHHDTNLYDLRVSVGGRVSVIGTTSNHLFWDQASGRWVEAGALTYGTPLRTPGGGTATVLGGYTPKVSTGWMWDLTIPRDHDFYVQAAGTAILVHNCVPLRRYQGGVYTLREEDTGVVVRTGKTGNLYERRLDHARHSVLGQYRFHIEYLTDDPDEQAGLEQMLYDKYPEAQRANGGFNKRRAVDPANRDYQRYMQAAQAYLDRQAGG